jgi:hypothetical protein
MVGAGSLWPFIRLLWPGGALVDGGIVGGGIIGPWAFGEHLEERSSKPSIQQKMTPFG